MKLFPNFIGSLLFFGSGYLVGQYQAVETMPGLDSTKGKDIFLASNQVPSDETFAKTAGVAHRYQVAGNSNLMTNNGLARQSSIKAVPTGEMTLSVEAQEQLAAQQIEAQKTKITAMDELILSLEQNQASAEEIQNFRDIKHAIDEQSVEEVQAFDANSPEPTNDELIADLAASLEQSGIPPSERKNMLESFAQQLESGAENSASEPSLTPALK